MKKRLLSGLVGLMVAQPALSIDLMETYEKALSYDSGIAAAQASFEAQQAASDVTRSVLLPQLGAFGEANYIDVEGPNQTTATANWPTEFNSPNPCSGPTPGSIMTPASFKPSLLAPITTSLNSS